VWERGKDGLVVSAVFAEVGLEDVALVAGAIFAALVRVFHVAAKFVGAGYVSDELSAGV